MAFIQAEMKLSDVILNETSLIPVTTRFGIHLGLGDKTIRTICKEKNLDVDFFVSILNTFIHVNYFPQNKLLSFCGTPIVDYLTKTNQSYERFLLPNIERHLNSFIERSNPENTSLEALRKFFQLFKKEMKTRIERDNVNIFPLVKDLTNKFPEEAVVLENFDETEDVLEEKLLDMKIIMVKHLNGEYDENLCYAVLVSICNLEKDINQNNRIRNKILFPLIEALKKKN
ncbi:MAG: helix-turn-helix transcriptional regulator [Bacteroidales bacterium]|nr:helix-turn-helix transcriptional regulator [Bacteroidales bacterium]